MRRVVVVVASLIVGGLVPAAGAATPDMPLSRGDFAGTFGIGGGRTMFLECFGDGSPTVILDSGLRNGASIWNTREDDTPPVPTVLPGVARFTRVCGYDRPGTIVDFDPFEGSRSSPVPMPRPTSDAVSDLHAVLKAAGVPAPFVLVGHSTGGLIDRQYAAAYPRQVAGLVQVDALAEFLQDPFTPDQMAAYSELNNGPVEGIDYPDLEQIDFARSFAQMRKAARRRPLGDIPLSVLSHGLPFGVPDDLPGGLTPEVIESSWTRAQTKLAKLTPDASHVIAKASSHYIMLTQPELVIREVRRVVRAVRAGD